MRKTFLFSGKAMPLAFFLFLFIIQINITSQHARFWENAPDNIKNKNSFKRYLQFHAPRMFPADSIPYFHHRAIKEEIIQQIEMKQGNYSSSFESSEWEFIGPKGIDYTSIGLSWGVNSGRVRGLAIHPNDPNTVYIGASAGGIWKTTNGGTDWEDLSGHFNTITFGAITIDPNNPNNVYAGTGEGIAGGYTSAYSGDGFYKSTDAGKSWMRITNGFGPRTHFTSVKIHPNNSNILLATLSIGNYAIGSADDNAGVWRSTDAGLTWTQTLMAVEAFDVAFHPTSPNIVFAGLGGKVITGGIFVSQDAGITWSHVTNGLPNPELIVRLQLAIAKSQPQTMYAYIHLSEGDLRSQVFKSTDGGNNWFRISSNVHLGGDYGNPNDLPDQGEYDLCIAVDPVNPNKVLVGNVEIHHTNDGANFSPLRQKGGTTAFQSVAHVDYHVIQFAPSDPNIIYVGTDGGVYRSVDNGNNWNSINNGLSTLQYYRIASHPTDPNILLGGFQDNGNAKADNAAETYWNSTTGGDGMECFFNYEDPTIYYASNQNGTYFIFYTENDSQHTEQLVIPHNKEKFAWTAPFMLDVNNPNIVYAASNRPWISTDKGETWTPLTSEGFSSDAISELVQSKVNTQYFAALVSSAWWNNGEIFFSTDGGMNWINKMNSLPLPERALSRLHFHPTEVNTIFLTRYGYNAHQVFKSTDLGDTWVSIQNNLPDLPASDFFIDPVKTNYYFVANDAGVYYSSNMGTNWERLGSNLPVVPVFDFDYAVYGDTRYLRIATHGRSAFQINLGIVTSAEEEVQLINNYYVEQNYPNPFNPVTRINYSLAEESSVKIRIYNTLGQLVTELVNKTEKAGNYTAYWNAEKYSSGVYFYSFETLSTNGKTNFSSTKKMILQK